MVGAEMPMTSDQVVWSEQNRLHVAYDNVEFDAVAPGGNSNLIITLPAGNTNVAIRQNQTIVVSDGLSTVKCLVIDNVYDSTTTTLGVRPYTAADLSSTWATGTTGLKIFVYGSEFEKGREGTAQIGWVEVATEDGTSGYFWYLKAESETRLRFEDYLEMSMVEAEKVAAASTIDAAGAGFATLEGSEGMFAAIEERGNVYNDFAGAAAPGAGAMADFDDILKHLDKQGAIEENMLFLSRRTALDFDDMIGAMAGGGYASTSAASYGLFDNEAEMALNFGFSGFRRGSYDFYKTDWKYLNDASTRGLTEDIDGVLVPAGTSTVYDQILGQNIRRPFLHVRYRASQADDRRMKSWITGFLSERCLCVQAANNFVLFKSTV
jgi:hypothetical protein